MRLRELGLQQWFCLLDWKVYGYGGFPVMLPVPWPHNDSVASLKTKFSNILKSPKQQVQEQSMPSVTRQLMRDLF